MESSISEEYEEELEDQTKVEERVQAVIKKALGTGDNDLDELTKEMGWLPRKGWSQYPEEEEINIEEQEFYQVSKEQKANLDNIEVDQQLGSLVYDEYSIKYEEIGKIVI